MGTFTKKVMKTLLSVLMCFSVLQAPRMGSEVHAAANDVPDHDKILTINSDGTYTIALNVTGDSEKNIRKVNVIVVFDTSSSMNTRSGTSGVSYTPTDSTSTGLYGIVDDEFVPLTRGGTYGNRTFWYNGVQYTGQRYTRQDGNQSRLQAAESAVNELAHALLAYNSVEGNPEDTVEMAFVDFANTAVIAQSPTTSYDDFAEVVFSRDAGNNNRGTNWEAGLAAALNVNFNDSDPTYVIFVSDGAPTFRTNANGYTQDYNNTYGVYGTGSETNSDNVTRSYNAATDDAKAIVDAGYEFYTIFAYGSTLGQTNMTNITTASGAPASHNFSAANTAELQEALATILNEIEMAGIGAVSMSDGTTSSVTTTTGEISNLLTVDTSSYKYYRAGGLENGSEKYDSTANGGLGEEWTDAPTAKFEDGAVIWDLKSEGVLENDVTYTVTFDCWPSQTTLDIAADIKNNPSSYNSLDANIKKYINPDGSLKTNTTASLSYTDTRTGQSASSEFENPDPVTTSAIEQLAVSKEWENAMDGRQAEPITLTVTRDGNPQYTMTLGDKIDPETGDPIWSDNVWISIGILRHAANGEYTDSANNKYEILETGHDFTFEEPKDLGYYWELDVPTVRPMMIDGTLTMLIKKEGNYNNPNNTVEYTINGKTYYVGATGAASLTATNHRRARLNLTKVVDGEDADPAQTFPFTLNVVDSKASEGSADNLNSDYYVWFSIYNGGYVEAVVSGAEKEMKDGEWTGYYYAPSGSNIVVNLKAGDNLRFINLPVDTKYTFTEGTMPDNYTFTSSVLGAKTWDDDGNEVTVPNSNADPNFSGAKTTTGTIKLTNTDYTVTYKNTYSLTDIEVTKVWVDNSDQDGKRPTVEEFKSYLVLKADGTDVTSANADKLTVVVDPDDSNKFLITWTGLDRYADGKEIKYTVEENAIPLYETEGSPAEDHGTITNSHETITTDITVKKQWDDGSDQDGKRPASVTFQLFADGKAVEGKTITLSKPDGATVNEWTAQFEDLPQYANGKEIVYSIKELKGTTPLNENEKLDDNYTVTYPELLTAKNSYTPEVTKVTASKTWSDNSNQDGKRPENATVQLYKTVGETKTAVGSPVTVPFDGGRIEPEAWTNLPVYENGVQIKYSVEETLPEGSPYTKSGDGTLLPAVAGTTGNVAITNSYTPATFQLEVDKVWADNNDQDGIRPSTATVQLYQKVGSGVETAVTGKSETVPYAGGEVVTWTLPVYENGQQITYSIQETLPENSGYTSSVSSPVVATENPETTPVITVTNTHTPYTTKITITKTWDDKNDQDALRDGVVGTITLTRKYGTDGSETKGEVKLEAEATWTKNGNVWTVEIDNLPVNINGNPVTYSIDETLTTPNGYTIDSISDPVAAVTGDSGTLNVTNKHVPEVTTVTVVKNWVDNSDQDGKRTSVGATVQLYRAVGEGDKTKVGDPVTVGTDNNSWTYTWDKLDKYEGGQAITYSVEESKNNEIYTTVITDPVLSTATERTITVTNTYTPETTNIKVVKVWNDNSDQDGIRKDVEASVQLYAQPEGGERVAVAERTAPIPTANTSNELDVITFTGLPVYEDGKKITYSIEETITTAKGYELESISDPVVAVDSATGVITVTNKYTPETVKVTVIKVWDDNKNQDGKRPEDLDVALLADKEDTGKSVTLTPETWTGSIEGLPKYKDHGTLITYTWSEEELPEGYELTKTEVDEATGYITTLTNSYKPEETTITVTKKWNDADDQDGLRASVEATVTLYKTVGETTTEIETVTVPYAGGTIKTWDPLPVYENGVKIVYSVVETLTVDKGYKTDTAEAVTVANGSTKEITNSYTPEVTTIEVTKKWDDNNDQDGKREGVVATVTLYKTVGETTTAIETVDVPYTDGVVKKWENLPVYEKVGQKITYTVKETLVTPNEYTTDTAEEVVVANGGTKEITNRYTPETTKLTVTKTWADSNDQDGVRKDVGATVQLYKTVGETKTAIGDPIEVGTADDWSKTWEGLPVYENKTVIVYSVEETLSEDTEYAKSGDDVTKTAVKDDSGTIAITNTYVTKVVEISVEKVWDDNEDQDGFRPDSVTVILKADGETVRQVELTAEGEWKATVDKLPMYKAGVEIKYEFDELKIAEYDTEIENTAELVQTGKTYQFTVTNTHEPETTKITVTKLWDDANDQDGIRKNVGATVQLYKTVGETKTAVGEPVEVGTEDDWSHVFGVDEEGNTTLPVYEGGKKITYSVEETLPDGSKYTKSGDDVTKEAFKDESGTIEIKNSYTPELTTATVKKVWDDDNNNDGFRPEKLTVKLLADEKDTGKTVELTEENEWTATIEELDKYRDHGTEIKYTWEEVDLPKGYELTNTATEGTVTTLTNTHNNELVEVPVEKVWKGDEDYDVRPESIEVKLTGTVTVDGKEEVVFTETQKLEEGEDGKWTYTWTKLNKRYNGVEIEYTVEEPAVPAGYKCVITGDATGGYTITNTFKPFSFDPPVIKVVDGDHELADPNETFTFKFEAIANEDGEVPPMPEGSEGNVKTITIPAGKEYEFGEVEITKIGKYTYEITEVNDGKVGYTYDEQKYVLVFDVHVNENNELTCDLTINGELIEGFKNFEAQPFEFINIFRETVEVTVEKVWEDNNNADGKRPEEIEVTLYANDKAVETVKLNEENGWKYTFEDLPFSDDKFEEIQYTVKEDKVPEGYSMSHKQSGYAVTITNTKNPPETSDSSNLKLWATLMTLSMTSSVALAGVALKKRKEEEE